jgi:transcriptional regulator with XRE-family HTH domain
MIDVREAREAVGVTQRDLAQRIGWSQTTLSNVEAGKRDLSPGEETLITTALASNGHGDPEMADLPDPEPEPPDDPPEPHLAGYPAAPQSMEARRAWMRLRNAELQKTKLVPPASGTFGGKGPKAKT